VIRYDDDESRYGNAVRFTGDVEVTDAEFVRVRCYSNSSDRPFYTNFHAVARLKPDVEHRCNEAMKQRRRTDDVLDVLMVGVDSTSRLNSIRRLNSTRQFLLQQLHVRCILLCTLLVLRVLKHRLLIINLKTVLQRAQCEARIASAVLAIPIPSVRPSVRPSVTLRYCVKTTARTL